MQLLILGQGKTGSQVAEVARERRHHVQTLRGADNAKASALTPESLAKFDAVIDFTNPTAVVPNIEACIRARKAMVIGTTGWYDHLPRLHEQAQSAGSAILYGSNFSIGVNLFFEIVRTAAAALNFDYSGQIFERHHAEKKDAPSGTAMVMQKIIREAAKKDLEIVSFREGDAVGMHELVFNSPADRIYLCHDSKSRRGFAEGAVRAAEWLVGKTGVYDFREIWRNL
ncbi:MAG TPA: dihydrodipicolinate reductase C-terminal domain-containing protein [Terriglobales bacterium]|nr:dihydrodipicolinate reductase C-terminal domain-containing protein [Terriglobales bacterium]